MKVRCIDDLGLTKLEVGKIYEGELKFSEWWEQDRWFIKGMENLCFREHAFEIVKEDNMEKTFREVIADIKEGEVWEITKGNNIEISLSKNGVTLDFKKSIECEKIFFPNDTKFKLKREEYTFEEAFKAYEEGKEIQSASTDKIYHKEKDFLFASYEISKKWYINN